MQENEAAHAKCRYWSVGAVVAYRQLLRDLNGAQDQEDAVKTIRERCCLAVSSDDPEQLCAVLAVADRSTAASTDIRFATAVASMAAKKYECAYAAWDDGGACWSKASDDPWVPDSAHAAAVLMGVCDELTALRAMHAKHAKHANDMDAGGDSEGDGEGDVEGDGEGDGEGDSEGNSEGDATALCDMMSGLST